MDSSRCALSKAIIANWFFNKINNVKHSQVQEYNVADGLVCMYSA